LGIDLEVLLSYSSPIIFIKKHSPEGECFILCFLLKKLDLYPGRSRRRRAPGPADAGGWNIESAMS